MIIYITLSGGWDKSIDEIPEPNVISVSGLDSAILEMIDYMADDPGISDGQTENIYPLISGGVRTTKTCKRALKLLDIMIEADYAGSPAWQEARKELLVMLKDYLHKHGRLDLMQFWDCYEGSFYGIFAKEI